MNYKVEQKNDNRVRYGYRLCCIERVCMVSGEISKIDFFWDQSVYALPTNMPKSHGLSYLALRQRLKDNGQVMGLENERLFRKVGMYNGTSED